MNNYFYWPLKERVINQKFGENRACVDIATGTQVITCDGFNPPAGYKSVYGPKGHLGLDLKALHGTEVYCSRDGVVSSIDTNPRTGLDVKVISVIGDRTFRHYYEHLLGYQPKVGDKIYTGQIIGWADSTGYSSADHLHFQLEELIGNVWIPVDPLLYLAPQFAKDILMWEHQIKYLQEQVAKLADSIADYLRKKGRT